MSELQTRWQRFWLSVFQTLHVAWWVVILIAIVVYALVREARIWGC